MVSVDDSWRMRNRQRTKRWKEKEKEKRNEMQGVWRKVCVEVSRSGQRSRGRV